MDNYIEKLESLGASDDIVDLVKKLVEQSFDSGYKTAVFDMMNKIGKK